MSYMYQKAYYQVPQTLSCMSTKLKIALALVALVLVYKLVIED